MSRKSIEARDILIRANSELMLLMTSHIRYDGSLYPFNFEEKDEIQRLREIIKQYLPKEVIEDEV